MSTQMCSIREMTDDDWPEVRKIYADGIATGHATFEIEVPSWEQWNTNHHQFARLVMTAGDVIKGWAALSPVSARQAYRGVAEVSVYVGPTARGHGLGRQLLLELIRVAEHNGVWTLQASIFPENVPSIELHNRCGFREVGRRERIAQLNGVWRDTVLLERRSTLA
jgi:L-amino acid N-acyltransferase YncA